MKITMTFDDGTIQDLSADSFHILTINYQPVQNEITSEVHHIAAYHCHVHGDTRELTKELRQRLEENYAHTSGN